MASRIIGVLGKKRHGKDTFAARLVAEYGFTQLAFADKLREAALAIDPIVGWPRWSDVPYRLSDIIHSHGWEGVKGSEYADEVRRILQRVGITARELDPDIWVRPVLREAERTLGPVVVTDVRFPNEVAAIEHRGGRTVRIVNPRVAPTDGADHISETALDLYTPRHVVMNSGTIEDLHKHADRIASLS